MSERVNSQAGGAKDSAACALREQVEGLEQERAEDEPSESPGSGLSSDRSSISDNENEEMYVVNEGNFNLNPPESKSFNQQSRRVLSVNRLVDRDNDNQDDDDHGEDDDDDDGDGDGDADADEAEQQNLTNARDRSDDEQSGKCHQQARQHLYLGQHELTQSGRIQQLDGANTKSAAGTKAASKQGSMLNSLYAQPNADYDDVKHVDLFGVKIVALTINGKERLCLAQISNTLLKDFSYNEIHNRRVALGITCVQCTPIQLEMLRRAGAMPSSSRRCGMITMREAERLCRSFLAEEQPPELPENFYFTVGHRVNYGCKGRFIPARYISSRAKCIECFHCGEFYSPNKFIFHSHKQPGVTDCNPPDSPNINSWRKHINLDWTVEHSQEIKYAWEDVKSLFNGGTRRRATGPLLTNCVGSTTMATISQANRVGGGGGGGGGNAAASVKATGPDRTGDKSAPGALQAAKRRKSAETASQQRSFGEELQAGGLEFCHDTKTRSGQQSGCALASGQSTMSQGERRKLPMGWAAAQGANLQADTGRQHQQGPVAGSRWPFDGPQVADNGGQNSSVAKRASPSANSAPKRLLSTTNWHAPWTAAGTIPLRDSASMATDYAPVAPKCDERQCHTAYNSTPCGQQSPRHSYGQQQQSFMPKNSGDRPMPTHASQTQGDSSMVSSDHSMTSRPSVAPFGSPRPPPNYGAASSGAQANSSNFIYSQLYSHLMQSRLAQQQRQQQLSPIEAQLALRHHIWSSLLANLRCNPALVDTAPGNPQTNSQPYSSASHPRVDMMIAGVGQPNDTGSPLDSPPQVGGGFNPLDMLPLIYNGSVNSQLGLSEGTIFATSDNKDACK